MNPGLMAILPQLLARMRPGMGQSQGGPGRQAQIAPFLQMLMRGMFGGQQGGPGGMGTAGLAMPLVPPSPTLAANQMMQGPKGRNMGMYGQTSPASMYPPMGWNANAGASAASRSMV